MSITVLSAGIALPQDDGRIGYANVGVARSGAFDHYAHKVLGCLLGYPQDYSNPSIEILAGKLSLRALDDAIFAVTGAAKVDLDGFPAPVGNVLEMKAGQHLSIEVSDSGPAYLGFDGLFFPRVLDSISFDTMSGIGNQPLKAKDIITIDPALTGLAHLGRFAKAGISGYNSIVGHLRVVSGPHDGLELLTSRRWRVKGLSRSGIRLVIDEGQREYDASESKLLESGASLKSMPMMVGAIQLPPSGDPILLGPDSGVTGGYMVPGTVITADLSKLARINAYTRISLIPVTQSEANRIYAEELAYMTHQVIRREEWV